MQVLRDAATLGILLLLALTVRIDFGDGPSEFGGVRAGTGEPAIEAVPDPATDSPEGLIAELPPEAKLRTITATTTLLPFPGVEPRIEEIGNGRILIIIDGEETSEGASKARPPVAPPAAPCEKLRAHRSC